MSAQTVYNFNVGAKVRLRVDGEPPSIAAVQSIVKDDVLVTFPDGLRAVPPTLLEIL